MHVLCKYESIFISMLFFTLSALNIFIERERERERKRERERASAREREREFYIPVITFMNFFVGKAVHVNSKNFLLNKRGKLEFKNQVFFFF